MRILVLLTLLMSFALFAKPSIDYKYIPKDANLIGHIATKKLTANKHFKKFLKTKDGKDVKKKLKVMGINLNKLGSVFFYSNADKVLGSKNPEKDVKELDFAIILKGITFEKFIKELAKKEKKNTKIIDFKGHKIYQDLSSEDDTNNNLKAISFVKGSSVIGSVPGVKKVIKSIKGKSTFSEKALVNKMHKAFVNPHVFIINIINSKQKALINSAVTKNSANPVMAMLGIPALSKAAKSLGFALKLNGNKLLVQVAIQADKATAKSFITGLNMQFKQFKPMIMQQVSMYAGVLGPLGVKELKSIINSLKIVQKKDLALVSFKVNVDNVAKIMKKMDQQKSQQNDDMMKMMQKK